LEIESADFAAWSEIISANLPHRNNLKVLDVGTGAGFFAVLLSKLGHEVTGVDMSAKMLEEAKKNIAAFDCRADFVRMNAQELKFAAESFDVVISRNLTWTLPDAMQAYKEWCRVLKVGGVLMNFDSDYGDKNFTNAKTCAKAGVEDEMLVECTEIKNSLRISTHNRPRWDIELLEKLGLKVTCDSDIAPFVHKSKNLDYDIVPLFGIYAVK
jgi:SAM-dependent methyltransferase